MRLFGIDIGRAETGYASYDTDTKEVFLSNTIALPIGKMRKESMGINPSAYRLARFRTAFQEDIYKAQNGFFHGETERAECFAMIEDYAYGDQQITLEDFRKMDKMSLEVAEMSGVVYEVMASRGIPYYKVAPSQLKCFVTGDGRCEKLDMVKALQPKYGCNLDTHHEYDALGCIHVLRYLFAYLKNPDALKDGTYEKNVCIQLAYDTKYASITGMISTALQL
jgi:hypothetical protein